MSQEKTMKPSEPKNSSAYGMHRNKAGLWDVVEIKYSESGETSKAVVIYTAEESLIGLHKLDMLQTDKHFNK